MKFLQFKKEKPKPLVKPCPTYFKSKYTAPVDTSIDFVNPDAFILLGKFTGIDLNHNTIADIVIKIVCDTFHVNYDKLVSKTRKREVTEARQLIASMIKKYSETASLSFIGKRINRDHATVLHSIRVWNNLVDTNPNKYKIYQRVSTKIDLAIKERSQKPKQKEISAEDMSTHIIKNWDAVKHLYS
jgi:hypothetical protein